MVWSWAPSSCLLKRLALLSLRGKRCWRRQTAAVQLSSEITCPLVNKTWPSPAAADNNRSFFHDDIQGTTLWPKFYDGRAIISDSYRDHTSGVPFDENKGKFSEAAKAGDASRQVTWS